jgi:hypothetical protein
MTTNTWTIDRPMEYLFGVGHMHTGAVNVSVFLNGEFICATYQHTARHLALLAMRRDIW